jgi:transcriptional regulator with XRE-family HTH domain
MIYKNIGKMIQKAREEADLSQEELSSRLGYTQAALSNYELGKRRLYLANIEQIAKELNKPLSYFMDDSASTMNANQEDSQDETISEITNCFWSFRRRSENISLNILSGERGV